MQTGTGVGTSILLYSGRAHFGLGQQAGSRGLRGNSADQGRSGEARFRGREGRRCPGQPGASRERVEGDRRSGGGRMGQEPGQVESGGETTCDAIRGGVSHNGRRGRGYLDTVSRAGA